MPLTNEQIIEQLAELHSMNAEAMRRLEGLEEPGPGRAKWIVSASKRLEALEARSNPNELDARLRQLEQLCSRLAADVSRVDNKTEPAKGTTAKRLEKIETQIEQIHRESKYLYGQSKSLADRIAALDARTRDLICTLQAWAPGGDEEPTSLPARLKHLFNLTPNDLLNTTPYPEGRGLSR